MMRRNTEEARYREATIQLDQLVPADHLVRQIEAALDLSFIYDEVASLYAPMGRPSIDPVRLVKMVLLQYLFGIRSMRQTVREIETNVAYRWFLGLDLLEPVPHFSTFGKNYTRRFRDSGLFEAIFERVLAEAAAAGFVDPSVFYIDATHVKANANKKKFDRVHLEAEARAYQEQLDAEIHRDREVHGKKPLPPARREPAGQEVKQSTTDPDSGYYVKDEREKMFAYSWHTACDRNGFVLGAVVTGANVHDSRVFHELLAQVMARVGRPYAVAVDAGYKTPAIAHLLREEGVRPVMPYTRPKGPPGRLRKQDFVYDAYLDAYLCPEDQALRYRTTNREGYQEYVSDPAICQHCPLLESCTQSQDHRKVILRHVWQDDLDEAEHLRHTPWNRRTYAERKEAIERIFADLKQKHGLRWTLLAGGARNTAQAMLVYAAMNLKKLATWRWRQTCAARRKLLFFPIAQTKASENGFRRPLSTI